MRRLAVAILVLLATPALSGCISVNELFGLPAPPAAPAADVSEWQALAASVAAPAESVTGFRLEPETPGLRFLPATSAVDRNDRDYPGYRSPLQYYPAHLIIYGPDQALLYRGDPTPLDQRGNDTAADADAQTPESAAAGAIVATPQSADEPFLTLVAPEAGSYTMVMYGELGTPRVEMHGPAGSLVPQVVPLRLVHSREIVHGDPSATAATPISGTGVFEPPAPLALAWIRPVGEIAFANLSLSTALGAHFNIELLADANPASVTDSSYLVFASGPPLRSNFGLDPLVLDGGPFQWSVEGFGIGAVAAHTLTVSAVPHVPAVPAAPSVGATVERTPLAGHIEGGHAAWFDLPADSRLRLNAESTRGGVNTANAAGADVRIYDIHGNSLAARSVSFVPDEGPGIALPAGRLVIINDGPARITAEIVGRAPADAGLHEVPTDSQIVQMRVGRDRDEAAARLTFDAPVVTWWVGTYEVATGVQVTLSSMDEEDPLLAAWPHQVGRVNGGMPCCGPSPILLGPGGPGWQLHGGTYRLTTEAYEGDARLDIRFKLLDLEALAGGTS